MRALDCAWNVVCVCGAGLAGVYNISDHYEFEYGRGVEDISTMTRAMYGPELFERFSPSVIVGSLPRDTRFVWRLNNCNFSNMAVACFARIMAI